jgi:amino acid transporter
MGVDNPPPSTSLRRTVGLRTVVSTSAGLTFASSTFLVVVFIGHSLAGDAAWIPILVAGILCAMAAAAFSELNGMYPSASGIRLYIQRSFGETAAHAVSLTYMSVVALVVGTEAYVLSYVLNAAIPAIAPPVWIFLMLSVATAANFRGLKVAGALQDIITYAVIASILAMSVCALSKVHFHVPGLMHPGSIGTVLNMVGFAVFLFVGFEWVTPLAEEVKDIRSISWGMFIALLILVVAYSLISSAMFADPKISGALYGTDEARNPIPHVVFALLALGPIGRTVMITTSLCMSLTTFNAGLITLSRFLYASAREHILPKQLEKVSVKYSTPYVAVFTVYAIALLVSFVVYFTKKYVILVNLAAVTESIIYALAAICVIALRIKEAQTPRPYKMWGGYVLPGLAALLFIGVGAGVIFTSPDFTYWGAGLLLVLCAAGWWAYVHFAAMPRKEKIKAEQAAKRPSRRPPKK